MVPGTRTGGKVTVSPALSRLPLLAPRECRGEAESSWSQMHRGEKLGLGGGKRGDWGKGQEGWGRLG